MHIYSGGNPIALDEVFFTQLSVHRIVDYFNKSILPKARLHLDLAQCAFILWGGSCYLQTLLPTARRSADALR